MEILAPCGGMESVISAVNSGADGIYLGASDFSARKNAENFTEEQLDEAVKLCHLSGVKVYLAINTLVFDNEMEMSEKAILSAAKCHIDGMIVQDFGIVEQIKKLVPKMPIHGSTQMTVNSLSGVKALEKLGFTRVVLGRELSGEQIKNITMNTSLETEVFVHGALCVCVSGQCYMSAVLGGRSGNRGLCAQPCRLNFSCGDRENILSLKDMSILEHLPEFEKWGVRSAKIEGRMKRPEYVAAAVNSCRKVLNNEQPDLKTLQAVFSRNGFTEGYFDDDYTNMSGIRTKEDVTAATQALAVLKQLYNKPYKRYNMDMKIKAEKDKPVECVACVDGIEVTLTGDIPQTAQNKPTSAENICERMSKLGGTVYNAGNITASIDDNLMLPASVLNELRRNAVEMLNERILLRNTPIYG